MASSLRHEHSGRCGGGAARLGSSGSGVRRPLWRGRLVLVGRSNFAGPRLPRWSAPGRQPDLTSTWSEQVSGKRLTRGKHAFRTSLPTVPGLMGAFFCPNRCQLVTTRPHTKLPAVAGRRLLFCGAVATSPVVSGASAGLAFTLLHCGLIFVQGAETSEIYLSDCSPPGLLLAPPTILDPAFESRCHLIRDASPSGVVGATHPSFSPPYPPTARATKTVSTY